MADAGFALDEIYSVDFRGVKIKLKTSAGTAFKFGSSSLIATAACYAILGGLLYLAYKDYQQTTAPGEAVAKHRLW